MFFKNDLTNDEVVIQNLGDLQQDLIKSCLEWYGEFEDEDFIPTDTRIKYNHLGEFDTRDDEGVLENIKKHITEELNKDNSKNNSSTYNMFDNNTQVAPYISPDGKWDIGRATAWLNYNAGATSKSKCATYVRMAMEAGGMSTAGRPVAAQDYVGFLPKKGFKLIATLSGTAEQNSFSPQLGDISVMSHGKYGHICMWTGKQWVSDFKQRQMWVYSDRQGVCRIFRYLV